MIKISIFKRRKKQVVAITTDYSKWEQDIGFLEKVLNEKIEAVIVFSLEVFDRQLGGSNLIKDEDLEEPIAEVTEEVMKMLSSNYKEFLISKYFSSEEELIKYIVERVMNDFNSYSINQNAKKVTNQLKSKSISKVGDLNKKKTPAKKQNQEPKKSDKEEKR